MMDASLQGGVVMTVPGDEIAAKAGAPAHGKAPTLRLAAVLMAETVLYAATWVLALSRQTNMEGNPVNWDHKLALLSTFVYLLVAASTAMWMTNPGRQSVVADSDRCS
jgi:hypothetical protein